MSVANSLSNPTRTNHYLTLRMNLLACLDTTLRHLKPHILPWVQLMDSPPPHLSHLHTSQHLQMSHPHHSVTINRRNPRLSQQANSTRIRHPSATPHQTRTHPLLPMPTNPHPTPLHPTKPPPNLRPFLRSKKTNPRRSLSWTMTKTMISPHEQQPSKKPRRSAKTAKPMKLSEKLLKRMVSPQTPSSLLSSPLPFRSTIKLTLFVVVAKKPDLQKKPSGWFGGWFGKKDPNAPQTGPIKAKLGEESSFVYDPELKKWINK